MSVSVALRPPRNDVRGRLFTGEPQNLSDLGESGAGFLRFHGRFMPTFSGDLESLRGSLVGSSGPPQLGEQGGVRTCSKNPLRRWHRSRP